MFGGNIKRNERLKQAQFTPSRFFGLSFGAPFLPLTNQPIKISAAISFNINRRFELSFFRLGSRQSSSLLLFALRPVERWKALAAGNLGCLPPHL